MSSGSAKADSPTKKDRAEPRDPLSPSYRRTIAGLCLGIFLLSLAVFWRTRGFDFVNYDDPQYLELTYEIPQGLKPSTIRWAFTKEHFCNWHPLTTLSYLTEASLFG